MLLNSYAILTVALILALFGAPAAFSQHGSSQNLSAREVLDRRFLPEEMEEYSDKQLLGTVLFFLLAWPLAMLVSYILMRLAMLIPNRFPLGIQ